MKLSKFTLAPCAALLILLSTSPEALGFSNEQAHRPYSSSCPTESAPAGGGGGGGGGDFTPFPWGAEVPIGVSALEGIWVPTSFECGTYFSFHVTSLNSGRTRYVNIKQFDPLTCTEVAKGVGYELDRVFYVSMVSNTGKSFDLTVRAFDEKDLNHLDSSVGQIEHPISRTRPLIVATLYPRREWSKRISYPLVKIDNKTSYQCGNGDAIVHGR